MRIAFGNLPADRIRRVLTWSIVVIAAGPAWPTIGPAQDFGEPEIEPWLAPGTVVVLKDPATPVRDADWLSVSRDHLALAIEAVQGERLLVVSPHDIDPKAAGPYVLRLCVALARGDAEGATRSLDDAIRLDRLRPPARPSPPTSRDPADPATGGSNGDVVQASAIQEGRVTGPSESAKETQPEPKTAGEFLARGKRLYEQKEYNLAIDDISAAIKLEPGAAGSYALRAEVWGAKRNRDREIADLDAALQLDPTNTAYLLARAESWSSQGRHDAAMADYNEAIRLRPLDAKLYVARGHEWRRHVKLDLAVADYNQAIRLDPSDIHAYVCRAMVTKQRRNFPQAVAELTDLIRMAPDNAEVHRTLARILATCNNDSVRDGQRAVAEARRACELTQWRDPDCLDTLAAAYAETGEYQSAVDLQQTAIALVREESTTPLQRAMNFGGRRGVGFEDRLAFYKRRRPARE